MEAPLHGGSRNLLNPSKHREASLGGHNVQQDPHPTRQWLLDGLLLFALVSISTIIFYNSLEGQFCYDDHFAIKNNKDATGESSLWSLWTNDFWGQGSSEADHSPCVAVN
jgi:hypothetical protein